LAKGTFREKNEGKKETVCTFLASRKMKKGKKSQHLKRGETPVGNNLLPRGGNTKNDRLKNLKYSSWNEREEGNCFCRKGKPL